MPGLPTWPNLARRDALRVRASARSATSPLGGLTMRSTKAARPFGVSAFFSVVAVLIVNAFNAYDRVT